MTSPGHPTAARLTAKLALSVASSAAVDAGKWPALRRLYAYRGMQNTIAADAWLLALLGRAGSQVLFARSVARGLRRLY